MYLKSFCLKYFPLVIALNLFLITHTNVLHKKCLYFNNFNRNFKCHFKPIFYHPYKFLIETILMSGYWWKKMQFIKFNFEIILIIEE